MNSNTTQVWSWQGVDHSLVAGRVDHSRSGYYPNEATPGVATAYHQLWERLGTDQIIWCYASRDEHPVWKTSQEAEWQLCVPESAFLKIINTYIWNRISDTGAGIPRQMVHDWKLQWSTQSDNDPLPLKQYLKAKTTAYLAKIPNDQLWNHLFLNDASEPAATPLLRHPVKRTWVEQVTVVEEIRANGQPISHQRCRPLSLAEFENR